MAGNNRTLLKAGTAITALGIAVSSFISSCTKSPKEAEKNWVIKASDDRVNSLELNFDKNTGMALDAEGQTVEAEKIFEIILEACNKKEITTIFLADCKHSDPKKANILLNSFPQLKEKGFSVAIEDSPEHVKYLYGKPFEELTLKEINEKKDDFILYISQHFHDHDTKKAFLYFDFLSKAKLNAVNLVFSEKSEGRALAEKKAKEFLNELAKEKPESERVYNSSGDSIPIGRIFLGQYIKNLRDIAIDPHGEKLLIYRGVAHTWGRADLNERPNFGKSANIWNIGKEENLIELISLDSLNRAGSEFIQSMLDDTIGVLEQTKNKMRFFKDQIKPKENSELDLPDYLLIGGPDGKNPKLYETITYLKTHSISKENKVVPYKDGELGLKSIYDYIKELGLLKPSEPAIQR